MSASVISVIIPLYNKQDSIIATIKSVLSQTFTDFELIVVNDGSTDNSLTIIESIQDERIHIFNKANGGVSSARNYGVNVARGEWILFLDADDLLYERCLEILYKPTLNSAVDIVCAKFHSQNKEENLKIDSAYNFEGIVSNNYKWLFLNRFSLRMGGSLLKKEVVQQCRFDENFSRFEDMEAILEWIRNRRIMVLNQAVMVYCTQFTELSHAAKDVEKDFSFHMSFKNRNFWEKCILGTLLYLAFVTYPNNRKQLWEMYGWNFIYALISKIRMIVTKLL